jgi:hypothetical protein
MIPGAVHRSPVIYLRAEENPGKPQLGDRHPSNGIPYFQMRPARPHSTPGREKNGKRERTGRVKLLLYQVDTKLPTRGWL